MTTPRRDLDRLPWPIRQELSCIAAMLFEAFAEMTKGRLSEHYRSGRILALILYGAQAARDRAQAPPGEAFHLLVIVNHPRLARGSRNWTLVHDRLHRAWEFGEIGHPVRLTVESLDRFNAALAEGVPHFASIATDGVAVYATHGFRLTRPHNLSVPERRRLGLAEFDRWYERASDFLLGAAFFQDRGNAPMAALLLHQACEHLYQSVLHALTLHGPRTHALDELREAAETCLPSLRAVWPRETPFERRAFDCIRRAYFEVRYGQAYRISAEELLWAMRCAARLHRDVEPLCRTLLDGSAATEACHA
ncbi:DNA-binding protein [Sphingobium lactosutens]|uniref:HEPN domain-containing protein n=1 Tax=Sphingobium lactosutens TaxID=522773 RepID=UPI0015B86FDF|nr:HEPN domain-containing protein [Sphingobium lactosutens]NWK94684.1 DNA-binding protein [Sphingobium lactosutens]